MEFAQVSGVSGCFGLNRPTPAKVAEQVSLAARKVYEFILRNEASLWHYGAMATILLLCPKKWQAVAVAVVPAAMFRLHPIPMKAQPLVTDWIKRMKQVKSEAVSFTPSREQLKKELAAKVRNSPWYAITGESGVGKTQFIRELGCQLEADGAEVHYFSQLDFNSDHYDLKAVARGQMLLNFLSTRRRVLVIDEFAKLSAELKQLLIFNRVGCKSTVVVAMETSEWEALLGPPESRTGVRRRLQNYSAELKPLSANEVVDVVKAVRKVRYPGLEDADVDAVVSEKAKTSQANFLLSDVHQELEIRQEERSRG